MFRQGRLQSSTDGNDGADALARAGAALHAVPLAQRRVVRQRLLLAQRVQAMMLDIAEARSARHKAGLDSSISISSSSSSSSSGERSNNSSSSQSSSCSSSEGGIFRANAGSLAASGPSSLSHGITCAGTRPNSSSRRNSSSCQTPQVMSDNAQNNRKNIVTSPTMSNVTDSSASGERAVLRRRGRSVPFAPD
ncbi:unnamed protein product [Polarella glacialis]|uniref:Uncharacterized protein n=1 Tax=Polarella glacialis TaxID=89957 RepID=A0A813H092_POLGL|nr:unnamed protein product [Polarella glacialis]